MYQVTGLTADARQNIQLVAADGNLITLTLEFSDNQRGWFYSIRYLSLYLSQRRLVCGANLLRQFRGVIPFGLCVNSIDTGDPVFLDDFLNSRIQIYILDQAVDVAAAEAFIAS